jgi:hypothetical protein
MSAEYWAELYAQAELEADDTAAPDQSSELGQRYFYVEDADS